MMTKNISRGLLSVLCALLLMTSCKSGKQATTESSSGAATSLKYLETLIDQTPAFRSFSSKVRLGINLDGKELAVSGSLKMKKNEAIQISLTPILGIEVARIEITPEYILLIDRMNKRYVQAPLSVLKELGNSNLDFYSLQALFCNELFLPGMQTVGTKDAAMFVFSKDPDGTTIIRPSKTTGMSIRFITSTPDTRLTASQISGNGVSFEWNYAAFEPFAGKRFPSVMKINLQDSKRKASVTMELTRMNQGKDENIRTEIPRKYQQVDLNELIKQLMNI